MNPRRFHSLARDNLLQCRYILYWLLLYFVLFILTGQLLESVSQWLSLMLLAAGLLYLVIIDIRYRLLPDSVVFSLLWCGLLVNSLSLFVAPDDAIWGAALGYLFLATIRYLYRIIQQKEGMGYGDVKLLSAIGAWGGPQSLPMILMIAAILGLLTFVLHWSIGITLSKHQGMGARNCPHDQREVTPPVATPVNDCWKRGIPFGPSLACAGWGYLVLQCSTLDLTRLFTNAFQ